MFSRLVSGLLTTTRLVAPQLPQVLPANTMHSLVSSAQALVPVLPNAGGLFSLTSIRTKIRIHFPRPNERRRVKRHGWEFRMSTTNGRRVIMRRILKGRHVLTH
ncbi:39S ribosomal protein L34, mitochondrial [Ctenocephalides felis]|uniref:39S ribosomal protein L34, mitochondrial n=1 Tax=Ctenocephalides felis TaxID=7515 RepID=UPI000E6E3816|nr:39S ribosomal protein L34, mitochondrial [Ctenocephalides felis]